MKTLLSLLVFSCALSAQAVTISSGTVECYFEIASTLQPAKYEIVKVPAFSAMDKFEYVVENHLLQNRILFGYYPAYNYLKEVSHFALNLSYNTANSGVELPVVLDDKLVVVIGRQGSDLIGAFANCTIRK